MKAFKNWLHEMPKWAFETLRWGILIFLIVGVMDLRHLRFLWFLFGLVCLILVLLADKLPPYRREHEYD